MLHHGTISSWNDSRGFGFITQHNTKEELFFHISDCPQHGIRPQVGFIVSYQRQQADNGKASARQIQGKAFVPQAAAWQVQTRAEANRRPRNSRWHGLLLMMLLTVGITAYSRFSVDEPSGDATAVTAPAAAPDAGRDQAVSFRCDGRQLCSQMSTLEEARFFLQHCPDTRMDGDNDGEPCESQFAE